MNDGIIKDDGTSRLVRSVANFKEKYPTYDDFAEALVAGTLPLDVLFNADGWSQQPDFLNKANLLKDATAALFQLSGDTALPDRVFEILSKAALVGEGGGIFTIPGSPVAQLKVESGTYLGTDATTASLTFSAKPDVLFINGPAYAAYVQSICIPYGSIGIFDGNALSINFSWDGNTVSWTYGNHDAGYGLNKNGRTYYYAALVWG